MVSQYTWPNFRGGADREGVRILIQQQNFEEDVVYGKTKIFVRSPQTLFMLEQVNDYQSHSWDSLNEIFFAGSRSIDSGHSHFSSKVMERIRLSSSL